MCDLYGIWTFILPSFSSPSLNLNMSEPTDKEPQETADSGIMSKSKLLEEQVGSNVAVKCCLSMFLHKCQFLQQFIFCQQTGSILSEALNHSKILIYHKPS